jgi:hypothetical protein
MFGVRGMRWSKDATRALQDAYLRGFETNGTLTAGCRVAHVSPVTVYAWREHDDEFAQRENAARSGLADRLEAEAVRRAYRGWDRPIYQRGELVGYEHVYSDQLLNLMLKALRPEKFRERIDVSGSVEQVVRQVAGFNASEVL